VRVGRLLRADRGMPWNHEQRQICRTALFDCRTALFDEVDDSAAEIEPELWETSMA
jgi:hypothetical protein